MDTKTKIFWWTMGILILASFGATFYRYMVKKDYIVQAQVDCDPYTETCFVWECDPESEEEGEMCTDDPEEDIWYFKVINKNASKISSCDANDEDCDALVCAQNEPDCEFVFCTLENMEENYASACIDPAQYAIENPIEEEEGECEEGDEACLNSEEEDVESIENTEGDLSEDGDSGAGVEDDTSTETDEELESSQESGGVENEEESTQDVTVETENIEISAGERVVQKNEENGGSLPIIE
ncbi:MAG: hypothetical protein UR60_C0002G0003 [Candidatus Moranbacteria bacterium GW2011_GWF2_34_56]|nr:MAG: hypothetical protein UR51_C0009G0053 [Candidatus Moranbacteria bacterium GW2011_GWF1_34_10]KKP65351.1 MAG: hypothetical protein UR60_C0002G0003 [Candidatus Moranbacteria bacterium GW2011_GWF2_34_56]